MVENKKLKVIPLHHEACYCYYYIIFLDLLAGFSTFLNSRANFSYVIFLVKNMVENKKLKVIPLHHKACYCYYIIFLDLLAGF
jgi:hypothetical protein